MTDGPDPKTERRTQRAAWSGTLLLDDLASGLPLYGSVAVGASTAVPPRGHDLSRNWGNSRNQPNLQAVRDRPAYDLGNVWFMWLVYVSDPDVSEHYMSLEALPALAGIAVSMTWTPGPNNAMLSASGANYGWRRSMPHVMGVAIGFPVMLIVVAFGLVRVLDAFPIVVEVLRWIGLGMLAWFAWRIATAVGTGQNTQGEPLTFIEAIAFQWVNPKAWGLAIYVTAGYAVGDSAVFNTILAAIAFMLSAFASSFTWAMFGAGIGKALKRGWRLRAFNLTLAAVLLASGVSLMLGS